MHKLAALILALTTAFPTLAAAQTPVAPPPSAGLAEPGAPVHAPQPQPYAPQPQQPYAPQPQQPYAPQAYAQQPYAQPQQPYAQPQPYGYPAPQPYFYPPAARGRHRPIVGYRSVERANVTLWAPGLAMFLAGWVLNFAAFTPIANEVSMDRPASVEQDSWAWSLVPFVGPWVQLALEAPHPAIPITFGLLQLTGVGMFIAGLATTQTIRVPILAGDPEDPSMRQLDLSATPTAGGGTLALTYRHL